MKDYKYSVISEGELKDLVEVVNIRLANGWELVGGIATRGTGIASKYLQALKIVKIGMWDISHINKEDNQ